MGIAIFQLDLVHSQYIMKIIYKNTFYWIKKGPPYTILSIKSECNATNRSIF